MSDENSTIPGISFCLSIARITLGLFTDNQKLTEHLKDRYLVYLTSDIPQVYVRLIWRACSVNSPLNLPKPIFKSGKFTINSEGVEGFYDLNNRTGELAFSTNNPHVFIEYFLRLIYATTIFQSGGLLLHSAGIIRKERAHIFFGHSGSGKTTISEISKNETVLSDDLVILLPDSRDWVAYATPFWNPVGFQFVQTSAIIAGLYHLVQDKSVYKVRLPESIALAELLSNVPIIPLFTELNDQLLARGLNIINSIPIYALHFLPDSSFWAVVEE